MLRFDDIQNVFNGADLNENIDENVEEIELEISPINPENFNFVEETETYAEKTQRRFQRKW